MAQMSWLSVLNVKLGHKVVRVQDNHYSVPFRYDLMKNGVLKRKANTLILESHRMIILGATEKVKCNTIEPKF